MARPIMTGEGLHFMSEARLTQTLGFIDAGLASLARLRATTEAAALDETVALQFAALAKTSLGLREQLTLDLQPLLIASGPIAEARVVAGEAFGVDPAVQRMITATKRVLERLDEMICRLQELQQRPDRAAGASIQP